MSHQICDELEERGGDQRRYVGCKYSGCNTDYNKFDEGDEGDEPSNICKVHTYSQLLL